MQKECYNRNNEYEQRKVLPMKRIAILAAAALAAGGLYTAEAAPVTYVPSLSGNVGYSYNSAGDGVHNVYAEFSPINRLVIGAEFRHWINHNDETDVYAKVRLGHAYVGIGSRDYYYRGSSTYGLIEGMTNLAERLDAYAGLKFSDEEYEYKVGVLFDIMPALDLDINYTYYDRDHVRNRDGVGIGVNYRF